MNESRFRIAQICQYAYAVIIAMMFIACTVDDDMQRGDDVATSTAPLPADTLKQGNSLLFEQDEYHTLEQVEERLFELESQCGTTLDFQDVELYDASFGVSERFVTARQAPVGYHLDVGCSGTLITRDLFLSAGHCAYQMGHRIRFGYQVDDATGVIQTGVTFEVAEVIEQERNSAYDYAVVRLAGNPGDIFGFTPIANRQPDVNEHIIIMGHPGGLPKQISAGPRTSQSSAIGANWFRHQADTLGGSSGSGVLARNGALVGVHTDAGCLTAAPIDGNHAIRMDTLIAHSPILSSVLAQQQPPQSSEPWEVVNRPGAMCKGVNSAQLNYTTTAEAENSSSSSVDAVCPGMRVMKHAEFSDLVFGRAFVTDRHPTQDVCCRISSRNPGGGTRLGAEVCSTGAGSGHQILELDNPKVHDPYTFSHYVVQCNLPPVFNGARSLIRTYRVQQHRKL